MTLLPAYGRDYKSKAEVIADFDSDRDFIIADVVSPDHGRYVNRPQIPKGTTVNIRYARNTKVCVIEVK